MQEESDLFPLSMSVHHITCLKFQLVIPRLFPNLTSLTIQYSGLSQGKLTFYPVSEYKTLLGGLSRLEELEIFGPTIVTSCMASAG
jgi:hypothetical protein